MKCRDCTSCQKGFFKSQPNEYVCIGVKEPFVINNINSYCTEYKEKENKQMKLLSIKDVDKFFAVVNSCDGEVELISKEGDRLNLKSTLCQFIAKEVFQGKIGELEIVAHKPEDVNKLVKFMMEQ